LSRGLRWTWVAVALVGITWGLLPRVELYGEIPFSQAVYARDGRLLRLTLAADDQFRLRVPLGAMHPNLIAATLLHEDRHFYGHPGVNPVSLLRAAFETYVAGGRRQGASTLSMQLARLRFGLSTRTPLGKLEQIYRALQLERHYSKRQILEAYLNLAPYGANIEGVAAASWVYFHKRPSDLSLDEGLLLAVLPQSPARRNPELGTDELIDARRRLAERWRTEYGLPDAARTALELPVALHARAELPFEAPHFVRYMARTSNGSEASLVTSLDLDLQRQLEQLVRRYLARQSPRGVNNAAVLLADHATLEVRALIGSADFFEAAIAGQVDGTHAPRSPGSALKPFVYALALDAGLIHPETMLRDTPRSFGAFNPENFDGHFEGPISARQALVRSRNLPAVTLANRLPHRGLYGLLDLADIQGLRPASFYGIASVLGGVEVQMAELVELYSMLANGGVLHPLVGAPSDAATAGRRLLSPEASALTLEMLASNPRPGVPIQESWLLRSSAPVAWKTGTSHGFRDAWAVGVFDGYTLAVWLGNFDGRGNPAFVGRELAGPLFFEIVDAVRGRQDPTLATVGSWASKTRAVRREVCSLSGRLPNESCPERKLAWLIPGVSPIERCKIHRRIRVELATGLRVCPGSRVPSTERVYEFWPSDLLQVFERAGLPRTLPPPYAPTCNLELRAGYGSAPEILSPRASQSYTLRSVDHEKDRIPLEAISDADVNRLYWFVDGELLGQTPPRTTLFWRASPGQFTIRVVDDHGRTASRAIRVSRVD